MDEIISLYVISVRFRTKWLWVQIPLLSLEFISVSPNVKPALCLHFRKFAMKEHQGILKHYHKNISEKKADLLWKVFAIFCRFQPKLESQQFPSDSSMDHTTYCTYKAPFFL